MVTACAYIRVSTDNQGEHSPEAQIRLIREYAEKNDIVIIDIYQDIGISGRSADKRPEFQKMISTAKSKEHPYDMVLLWSFSRFARSQEEAIVYKKMLEKSNVSVVSISQPISEDFTGKLIERIFEWMDEYYSINLGNEVKRGMEQNALKGGYNGPVPYGYIKPKGGTPVIVEEQANNVRFVFESFASDKYSMMDIARIFNDKGILSRKGNKWQQRDIRYMLMNPFYIGKVRYRLGKNNRKPSDNAIIRDAIHEPIISEELFNKANSKIVSRNKPYAIATPFLLSKLVKCSECGRTLTKATGYHKKGTYYPYLICTGYNKGVCMQRSSIRMDEAEKRIIEAIKNISYDEYIPKPKIIPISVDNTKLINSLKKKLERCKNAYLNEVDTLEEYKANKERIQKEIDELSKEQIIQPEKMSKEEFNTVFEVLDNGTLEEKRRAITSIVDYIVYDKKIDEFSIFLL